MAPPPPAMVTRSSTHRREPSQTTTPGLQSETSSPQRHVSQAQGAMPLNVLNVVLGDKLIAPSYPSLYREELVSGEPVDRLYVCDRCFKYTKEVGFVLPHRRSCSFADSVPGRLVYEEEEYALYEVEGEKDQLFAQNLSLFCKLFIENKSVCFDVHTFFYYLLVAKPPKPTRKSTAALQLNSTQHTPTRSIGKIKLIRNVPLPTSTSTFTAAATSPAESPSLKNQSSHPTIPTTPSPNKRRKPNPNAHLHPHDPSGSTTIPTITHPTGQIVGFYSKEKLSWNNENLACILVFPPWQKSGLGQKLMSLSYELARREGRLGGPERPLSKAGDKSYRAFWERRVAQALLGSAPKVKFTPTGRVRGKKVGIAELSGITYMASGDVVETLGGMEVQGKSLVPLLPVRRKDGAVVVDLGVLREWCLSREMDVREAEGVRGEVDVSGLSGVFYDESDSESGEEEDEDAEEDDDG